MSTTDNVFSETLLQSIRLRADAIGFDDRLNKDYIPRTMDTINAMSALSTANITPLKSGKKDFVVEVEWANFCAIVAEECTSCDAGGATGSTNVEQYELTECQQSGFTVNHKDFATNDFAVEEFIAKGQLTVEKVLIEYAVKDFLTTLYANSGQNNFSLDTWLATNVGNETRINPVNYTAANLIPHLTKVAQSNQFMNPVMLSGNLLLSSYIQSKMVTGTFGDVGTANEFAAFQWYWDLWNFNLLGMDLMQFMVNKGATAFASRPMYDTVGIENWQQEGFRWSRPSKYFPELWIDWSRTLDCSEDRLVENYKGKIHFGNFVNPAGCNEQNTGILRYHAV